MAESILVTGKRISSMELVTNVTGNEKIPTGQPDDLAVTPNQIADHTIARGDLASQEDLSQVEVSLGTQITDLASDVDSSNNSIRGLIAAEEAARIAADNLKVDKEGSVSSVAGRVGDVVLAPSDVLVEGFGSQEDVNKYVPKPFLSGYIYGLGERVVLNDGEVVKSLVDGNVGNPNLDMTGWVSAVSDSLSDTIQTFNTTEAGVDPVTGVAEGAYFNVRSAEDDTMLVEYQNVGGVPTPSGKSYPSSSYVQEIAEYTTMPFVSGKQYRLNQSIVLDNGEVVKNTIEGNTTNPNIDMTGWVNEWADQRDKNSLSVDILDYIPKSQWSAIFNKTSVYDCSDALEQAINSGLEVKVSRSGLYVFKTAKEYATDIRITAEAPDVWFDFSQVPATQVGLKNSGSATLLLSAFASLITEGDRSITLPDVSGLQAGDTLCFYNPTDFSFSGHRAYYRDGEFLKIQQIVGDVVYFNNPIKSSYAASSIDIYKLNLKTVVLRDIKVRYYTTFVGGVGGIGALRFDFCDFKSYNFYAEAQSSQVLALSRCPSPKLYNTNGFNLGIPAFGGGGLEYFVLFGNCQDWRMYGGDIYSQRHAVAQGGGNAICCIPVSGKAYDLTTRNYFSTSVGSFDAHGNVRDCKLVNCTIYNSAKFAGSGVVYEGCKIYASQGGRLAFGTEFKGGRHGLINCELFSYASPRSLSHSYFDFGSNTEVITDKTVLDTEIFILNTKVTLRNANALDLFARVFNRGGSKKININFDNIEFDSDTQVNCVLRIEKTNVEGNTAVADSDYIVVDNIVGKNAPTPIIHGSSDYRQFPHRLPIIRGVMGVTTTASATVPVTGVAYGYTLPKRPFLQLNITGTDGAALSTLGGQSLFVPVESASGLTTFNASINAAAAFTAGAEFDLQYTASIREC